MKMASLRKFNSLFSSSSSMLNLVSGDQIALADTRVVLLNQKPKLVFIWRKLLCLIYLPLYWRTCPHQSSCQRPAKVTSTTRVSGWAARRLTHLCTAIPTLTCSYSWPVGSKSVSSNLTWAMPFSITSRTALEELQTRP